ncbi:MAG: glycoside hydrolase family 99-like domain-containing protein [Anaerolineales bacterium]|nr:glycoside hydrolase family 99-like domain-containing protein [Anaerolineales bacterium]
MKKAMISGKFRPIAFYLPQYHPIPENDEWWGRGFTEWVNVARARPLFPGHYQPHIPADMGFYDLRLPATRQAQADLARQYGIYGFCYYHYWFQGKLLLERPFNEVLGSGSPDLPFCLCWANESWNRRWDGDEKEILMLQEYSQEDDREHFCWLAKAFSDDRYIKVDGKPLFLVYALDDLPDPSRTASIWREEAQRAGFGGLYLCSVESYRMQIRSPYSLGFDAAVDFHPNTIKYKARLSSLRRIMRALFNKMRYNIWQLFDYPDYVSFALGQVTPGYKRFPCVMPSWDNTGRRNKGATIFINARPSIYEAWLTNALRKFVPYSRGENFIFINAWNEWAEGNHLEPCLKWGRGYLEATLSALQAIDNDLPGMDLQYSGKYK